MRDIFSDPEVFVGKCMPIPVHAKCNQFKIDLEFVTSCASVKSYSCGKILLCESVFTVINGKLSILHKPTNPYIFQRRRLSWNILVIGRFLPLNACQVLFMPSAPSPPFLDSMAPLHLGVPRNHQENV